MSCQTASDDGAIYKKRLGACSYCGDNGNDYGRCDSGVSTGNGSCQAASDDGKLYKKRMGACSCCGDNGPDCSAGSSSGGSHDDHTDHQQDSLIEESDSFPKRYILKHP